MLKRRFVAGTCFLLIFPTLGIAQTATSAVDAPDREEVLKLMDVMQVRERVVQIMQNVADQSRKSAEAGFKQKVPDATPQQLANVDALANTIFKQLPVDEVVSAMVPIYQKHLTKPDIDGILAFYSSPVGQKLLKEQPAMLTESMQAGGEVGRRILDTMNLQLAQQLGQMVQEEQQKKQPAEQPQPPKN